MSIIVYMPKLIEVPQGCYAEMVVGPNNSEVDGLCTFGMGPCCHVIISNLDTGYMMLCHADSGTDLLNGIPEWINKATDGGRQNTNLVINIGEGPGETRGEAELGSENTYYKQVMRSVPEHLHSSIVIQSRDASHRVETMVIRRNHHSGEYRNEAAVDEEIGLDIENLKLSTIGERPLFQGPFCDARDYATKRYQDLNGGEYNRQFPPACVYDGSSNDFLSLEEIKDRFDERARGRPIQINWRRVETNTRSRDPTPPSLSPAHSVADSIPEEEGINGTARNSSASSVADSIPEEEGINANLTRSDKALVIAKSKQKFIEILLNESSEANRSKISAMRDLPTVSYERVGLNHGDSSPQVTLIPEYNHTKDHRNNAQRLIQMIENGVIESDTVICIERKEHGNNFGMRDVRLLADIIEHNNRSSDANIIIPEQIRTSLIYQDALLYNAAKKRGIEVIGIEAKNLDYAKEHPEYNNARESYMIDQIAKIASTGRKILFPVGAAHLDGLKAKMPSIEVSEYKRRRSASGAQMASEHLLKNVESIQCSASPGMALKEVRQL